MNQKKILNLPTLHVASDELLHLDFLRFIACIGIVLHHSIEFLVPANQRANLLTQTMGLALFVDLFFVISGYVIAYVYNNRITSLADYFKFLQRRIGRLLPLHWLTLFIAIFLWSMFALLHYSGNHTPSFNPLCIIDTAMLTHAYIPCGNNIFFNGASWSISVEMLMYIVFPIFAFVAARNAYHLLIFVIVLGALIIFTYLKLGLTLNEISWVNIPPVLRALPSFILGTFLFNIRSRIVVLPFPNTSLAVTSFGLILGMIIGIPQLCLLILVYLVVLAAISADMQGTNKISKFIKRVAPFGQLTYSIYMWHGILILILMNVIGDKLLHQNEFTTPLLAIVCYASIFIISYLSYFYIETPARLWIDKLTFIQKEFD